MIISISGPSSTGKTTTIKKIVENKKISNFDNIVVVNENIREMFVEEFLPEVGSMENMMQKKEWILKWIKAVGEKERQFIDNQIAKYDAPDTLVILDRCLLDHFIYSLMHTIKYSLTFDEFYEFVKEYNDVLNKIDKIFLTTVPDNDFYDIDGVRPSIWKDTRHIENLLFQIMFKNQSIELPYDINERIKVIEKNISVPCICKSKK